MFLGTYTPKLDDKGRLTLPAKFREDLADGLMVTKGQDHSLAVYPRDEFAARARTLGSKDGLKVEILDDKQLEAQGYGGIIGVGKGSSRLPRLVRIVR